MGTVIEMMTNLKSLNVKEMARKVFEENSRVMVLLNLGQLFEGKNTKGEPFPEYAPWKYDDGSDMEYADVKHEMNPRPGWGNPDLKFTGSFYKGFYAKLEGNDILMESTDEKSTMLQEKYDEDPDSLLAEQGSNIFGLQDENQRTFNQEIFYPDFAKGVTAKTGLLFAE